jgi:hypothetical protein
MQYFGFMMGLFCASTILYLFYTVIRSGFRKRLNPGLVFLENNTPVLPYLTAERGTVNVSKGHVFEKFIISRFRTEYFTLLNYTGDKKSEDLFPLSNCNPDLDYDLNVAHHSCPFSIECVWRKRFRDGLIQWATEGQIHSYYSYQQANSRPIFIMLGVGGTPDDPENLYIIPLKEIAMNQRFLSEEFLQPFKKRDPRQMFFLNPDSMTFSL